MRLRAPMYVGNLQSSGLLRLFEIVVGNALVEFVSGDADTIRLVLHGDGSISVEDNGRGMPMALDAAAGEPGILHRLTHFRPPDGEWPVRSTLFPLGRNPGLPCVNFLSAEFDVVSRRGGESFARRFRQGVETDEVLPTPAQPGSSVRWLPDPELFGPHVLDAGRVAERLQELACLFPGMRIEWRDEARAEQRVFVEPAGIGALLERLNGGQEPLHHPYRLTIERDGNVLDLACAFTSGEGTLLTFVNGSPFPGHGAYLRAFQRGASRVLRPWAIRHGLLDPARRLSPNALERRLNAVFAFRLRSVLYEGAIPGRLGTPDAEPLGYAAGRRLLLRLTREEPDACARLLSAIRPVAGHLSS